MLHCFSARKLKIAANFFFPRRQYQRAVVFQAGGSNSGLNLRGKNLNTTAYFLYSTHFLEACRGSVKFAPFVKTDGARDVELYVSTCFSFLENTG